MYFNAAKIKYCKVEKITYVTVEGEGKGGRRRSFICD